MRLAAPCASKGTPKSDAPPSNHDDNSSEYDNENDWKCHDGDILGEEWLLDEYHGIDTCDLIDVDGVGISDPATRTCDVALEVS